MNKDKFLKLVSKDESKWKQKFAARVAVMNLYLFGKPEQTLQYLDVDVFIVAAETEEKALMYFKKHTAYNEDAVLKQVYNISNINSGDILYPS